MVGPTLPGCEPELGLEAVRAGASILETVAQRPFVDRLYRCHLAAQMILEAAPHPGVGRPIVLALRTAVQDDA